MKPQFDSDLAGTQHWMQSFIVSPEDSLPEQLPDTMVTASTTLTATERAGIYRDMYLTRMDEALGVDYPALVQYLGADGFHDLTAQYVAAYPSRSYTLNRLGDHLPDFIGTLPDRPDRAFLQELARLELALTLVFDAEESPVLTAESLATVPAEAWETARLQPIAAFQLLAFEYPVSDYLTAVQDSQPAPKIRKQRNWLVVYRRNYTLHRMDLKRQAFELLSALAAGVPFGEAVVRSRVRPKHLFGWFREWTSEGFFQPVSL